jgi:hypothetical protein
MKCRYCDKPATKHSGFDMYSVDFNGRRTNLGILYVCDAHDPHNKQFPMADRLTSSELNQSLDREYYSYRRNVQVDEHGRLM